MATGEFATERDDGAAYREGVPPGLDAHVDVDALAPGGLRERDHPEFGEQLPHVGRGLAHHVERHAGGGVEIDPHLVVVLRV